jgi:hypothetical protein
MPASYSTCSTCAANREDIVRIAKSAGVVGTLIDYDPATQKYAAAGALA